MFFLEVYETCLPVKCFFDEMKLQNVVEDDPLNMIPGFKVLSQTVVTWYRNKSLNVKNLAIEEGLNILGSDIESVSWEAERKQQKKKL